MKLVDQIKMLGEELTKRRVVENVLISVPKRFEAKISYLEVLKDLIKLTLTKLVPPYPPCPRCKQRNHFANFCWWRPNVKCRAYNQLGHVERVCKEKDNQQTQQAQEVESDVE